MIMLMLTGLKRIIIAIYYNHLLALLALEPIFRRSKEHHDRYERETIPTFPSHCTSVLIGFHNMVITKSPVIQVELPITNQPISTRDDQGMFNPSCCEDHPYGCV